nr:probable receptor-like protein kinase At1g80640 isoform X1 [Tanacetum cinerariifolium]
MPTRNSEYNAVETQDVTSSYIDIGDCEWSCGYSEDQKVEYHKCCSGEGPQRRRTRRVVGRTLTAHGMPTGNSEYNTVQTQGVTSSYIDIGDCEWSCEGCNAKFWMRHFGGDDFSRFNDHFLATVKILHNGGPEAQRGYENEVDWLGKLKHHNIVNLLGYCVHDNTRFFVYEMMHQGSLEYQLHDLGELHPSSSTRHKTSQTRVACRCNSKSLIPSLNVTEFECCTCCKQRRCSTRYGFQPVCARTAWHL